MGQMYLKVLIIMAVLFLFMVPGFVLKKLKMIGEGGTLTLSNILLYACQPALAINAFCVFSEEDYAIVSAVSKLTLLKNFALSAAVSLTATLLIFAICKLVFIKYKDRNKANIYSYIAIFSNCGFLGIPFIEAFTDGNPLATMYMMVFNVVFTLVCWTLGVYLITGNVKDIKLKKVVLTPSVISCAVALVLFFVPQINIFMFDGWEDLQIIPSYLSTMTAPLSMIIVGIRLAETPVKQLFCSGGIYLSGGLRLLVAPMVTLGIGLLFSLCLDYSSPYEEYVYLAPIIAMAMSPAASVVAMAESFNGDRQTAAAAFITNTLLSIITIPLVIALAMAICGYSV
ncbi:MAG: AEC family transporter [Clostridia bacterium]|nr:AEC family transporter [Clostridia bacterium]